MQRLTQKHVVTAAVPQLLQLLLRAILRLEIRLPHRGR